jgi:Nucleotidyltransferase domain
MRGKPLAIAARFLAREFPGSDCAFVSGSIMRGEGTKRSDIDLVVLFRKLPNAWRKSLVFESVPFECFVHDPGTMRWFFADGRESGDCSLAHMIATGTVLPNETTLSRRACSQARTLITRGPEPLRTKDAERLRYFITDLVDDLRDPRPRGERVACAAALYPLLAEAALRGGGAWMGKGKWIPRRLAEFDPALARRFDRAFDDFLIRDNATRLIRLSAEILKPLGGPLWEGWRSDAPKTWRRF